MMWFKGANSHSRFKNGTSIMVNVRLLLEKLEFNVSVVLGPIIRINPTEVHICDPDFYDTIYTSSAPFDKLKEWKYRFGLPDSVHATVEHDLHHHRRIALNPYFSKRQIYFLAPYIQERATKLANRLANEYRSSTKPVVMNDAWATYTADVVTYYCFAWSWDFVGYPDFVAPFTATTTSLASLAHISWHFAWLNLFFQSLPDMVLGVVYPTMKPIIDLQQVNVLNGIFSLRMTNNRPSKNRSSASNQAAT